MHPAPSHLPMIRRWITLCALLVALMVLIGGLTRLTESGLSIVQWKLLSGILPPLSEEAWQVEFSAYKTSPEYLKVNRDFGLSDFKHIFWLEYLHRILGRIIGLALILPLLYFAVRKQLPKPLLKRMACACVLVAAQGAVGWIMVASGLVNEPRVEPLKLALHLSLALALFALLIWTRWQVSETRPHYAGGGACLLRVLALLLPLQIVMGALVAGLDAGYSYNTFPLMDGQFIPAGLHTLQPWWLNHVESILTVQFQHRMGAYAVVLVALAGLVAAWPAAVPQQRHWLAALAATVCFQFALGVGTLLSGVTIAMASLHQLGAVLLLFVVLRLLWLYPCGSAAK